jgi:hypothetical protein
MERSVWYNKQDYLKILILLIAFQTSLPYGTPGKSKITFFWQHKVIFKIMCAVNLNRNTGMLMFPGVVLFHSFNWSKIKQNA